MKAKDRQSVLGTVECEGFDYAFKHYSDFDEIKDEDFHRLREAYLVARDKLADYLGIVE